METTWTQDGHNMETQIKQTGDKTGDKIYTKWRQNGDEMDTECTQN